MNKNKFEEMNEEEKKAEAMRRWNWLMGEIDCKPFINDKDYDDHKKSLTNPLKEKKEE